MIRSLSIIAGFLFAVSSTARSQNSLRITSGAVLNIPAGAGLSIKGTIKIENQGALINQGTLIINRTTLDTSNFIDNSINSTSYGAGTFVFTGTGVQNIKSISQFERIEVNNAGLNFLSDIKSNNWHLKSGRINTGAFNAIATTYAESGIQADATNPGFINSWFNGNLRRYINPLLVNNYKFPVGNSVAVKMAEIDNLNADPLTGVNYVTMSFGPKPGNDAGLNVSEAGTSYTSVNTGGVWYVNPDANPIGGKYDLKLFFTGFTDLEDNKFGILRRPDSSSNAADWIVPPGSSLPAAGSLGRTVAGGYARRNNISTFSQVGIGMSQIALPLQLLSFSAVKNDKTVLLKWVTTNEVNTSHFEVYRSDQPASLQHLTNVPATGSPGNNSTYSYTDRNPLNGQNFYQLKMYDKNNSYKLSQVIRINFNDLNTLLLYPNPVTSNVFFLEYPGNIKGMKLITAKGDQLSCSYTLQNNGIYKINLSPGIAKGIYTLQVNTDDGNSRNTNILIQ